MLRRGFSHSPTPKSPPDNPLVQTHSFGLGMRNPLMQALACLNMEGHFLLSLLTSLYSLKALAHAQAHSPKSDSPGSP